MPLMRRRPLLRAAAIGGGAYYAGKRRIESKQRQDDEHAPIDQVRQLERGWLSSRGAPAPPQTKGPA